jgi:hypothetical protein
MGDPVRDANANATAAYTKWRTLWSKLDAYDRLIREAKGDVRPEVNAKFAEIAAAEEEAWNEMAAARAALKGSKGGRSRRHRRRHRKTLRRK